MPSPCCVDQGFPQGRRASLRSMLGPVLDRTEAGVSMRAASPGSWRDGLVERLAQRYEKRTSAASRGEVSMLAGAGILAWAILTLALLISTPQASVANRTQLAVGVSGGLAPEQTPTQPAASPEGGPPRSAAIGIDPDIVAAGPPPEAPPSSSASPAPATPGATPRATPAAASATSEPVRPPTLSAGPPPPVFAPPPPPVAPPSPQLPAPSTPSATPVSTPPAVQVVGPAGVVLTGPRGGPLNTRGADLYDCRDFTSLEQLLAVFLASGPADPNRLDPGRSGAPCGPEDEPSSQPAPPPPAPEPPPPPPPAEPAPPVEPPPAEPPPAEPPPVEPPPAEPPPAEPPPAEPPPAEPPPVEPPPAEPPPVEPPPAP
jgi:hypothetical protein